MSLYVHYKSEKSDLDPGKVVSFQEAPEGKQDPAPAGLEILKVDVVGPMPNLLSARVVNGELTAD